MALLRGLVNSPWGAPWDGAQLACNWDGLGGFFMCAWAGGYAIGVLESNATEQRSCESLSPLVYDPVKILLEGFLKNGYTRRKPFFSI